MKIEKSFVSVLLVNEKRQALMQLRDNKPSIVNPGLWTLISGGIELGESYSETAYREMKEETGYKLNNPFEFLNLVFQLNGKILRRIVFIERYDNKQKIECYEGQKIEFVDISQLDETKIVKNIKDVVLIGLDLYDYL